MGIGLALITKAIMTKRMLPKAIEVFVCKSCNTLASVRVYKNRVEVVRCNC